MSAEQGKTIPLRELVLQQREAILQRESQLPQAFKDQFPVIILDDVDRTSWSAVLPTYIDGDGAIVAGRLLGSHETALGLKESLDSSVQSLSPTYLQPKFDDAPMTTVQEVQRDRQTAQNSVVIRKAL